MVYQVGTCLNRFQTVVVQIVGIRSVNSVCIRYVSDLPQGVVACVVGVSDAIGNVLNLFDITARAVCIIDFLIIRVGNIYCSAKCIVYIDITPRK